MNKNSEIERGTPRLVINFPNLIRIAKPLHDRLRKSPEPWSDVHTQIVRQIKAQVQSISLLHLADPLAPKIVETNATDIGYGGILKQIHNSKEQIIQFTSAHWNDCQKNHSTVKKEILSIVLCITKFQNDLLNQKKFYKKMFKILRPNNLCQMASDLIHFLF
ncbi:JHL23C [Salix suchowensis]|nr:JHL23C [Salix suchowensis]